LELTRDMRLFFIVVFSLFGVIAWTFDIVNVLHPVGTMTPQSISELPWPPAAVKAMVNLWLSIDPALANNTVTLRVLCAVSPFVYTWFYLFFIVRLRAKAPVDDRLWTAAVAWASVLIVTTSAVLVEAIVTAEGINRALIVAAYLPYTTVPLLWVRYLAKEKASLRATKKK
jgi:hypothetical protein